MIHWKGVSSLFLLTCGHIWRERNERTFRDKEGSVQQVISFIKDEALEWAFTGAKALPKLMFEPP
jgi:5-methylthioribose kinase